MPAEPSPWIKRFTPLIADSGAVLDVAAGSGRHARYFLDRGTNVTAVDIDVEDLNQLAADRRRIGRLELIEADLEHAPWPLDDRQFDAVIVTNYLYLPLMKKIAAAVAPDGVLLYETFGAGNEVYGRPSNPEYLLAPGVLLEAFGPGFQVVAYEHGVVEQPRKAVMSRICSLRRDGQTATPTLNP